MQHILVKSVQIIHFAFLIFVVFGWILPGSFATTAYVIVCTLMVLQWIFNRGTCLLTNLENMLKGQAFADRSESDGQFVRSIAGKFYKKELKDDALNFFTYALVYILMCLNIMLYCFY